jgi:hypothetical protein
MPSLDASVMIKQQHFDAQLKAFRMRLSNFEDNLGSEVPDLTDELAAVAAAAADALDRANHTGTQTQFTIDDLVSDLNLKAETTVVDALVEAAVIAMQALLYPKLVSARWYTTQSLQWGNFQAAQTRLAVVDQLEIDYFRIARTENFTAIGVNCTTFAGAGNVRLGIYEIGALGKPTTVIRDTGDLAVAGTGGVQDTTNFTLEPGIYGMAFRSDVANTFDAHATNDTAMVLGASSITATPARFYFLASSTGALPESPAVSGINTGSMAVKLGAIT